MDRREVLKQTCGMGLCGCAGTVMLSKVCGAAETATPAPATAPAQNQAPAQGQLTRLQWWLSHGQKQWAKLWELLEAHLDEKTRVAILEQLGRNCASSLGWAKPYKGNPEGFFKFMDDRAGERFDYDKDRGVITITTRERDCDCRLAKAKLTPPIYCACSIGWQKHTYETIFEKNVDVEVKESVLRGSKRCVFEVRVKS
jgi:predicted hydrocarbon binding protein